MQPFNAVSSERASLGKELAANLAKLWEQRKL